jgi:anti-sigma factor RsiW
VFAALSRARFETAIRRLRRRWMTGVAALAVLVLGLAVVWGWREARSDGGLSAAVVEDHLLYASRAAPAEFASADPAALADWFASRLDFAVRVPAIPGTTLLGGRLCSLTDRRAAVSFYRGEGGERMSLFQMTAENVQLGALRRMEGGRNRNLRCATRKGVSVLVWSDRGVLFALASEIGEDQLVRLAASL